MQQSTLSSSNNNNKIGNSASYVGAILILDDRSEISTQLVNRDELVVKKFWGLTLSNTFCVRWLKKLVWNFSGEKLAICLLATLHRSVGSSHKPQYQSCQQS